MITQTKPIDYSGQTIYLGIDVHMKRWKVAVFTQSAFFKIFSQDADPDILVKYLHRNFPNGKYKSVYEAGFCGFWIHESLEKAGIENIVVNAADVPTSDKDKKQKYDKVDARKLGLSLRSDSLHGIFIPNRMQQEVRNLLRTRYRLVRDVAKCKSRIKSQLHFLGIKIPPKWSTGHWSGKFINWLKQLSFETTAGKLAFSVQLKQLCQLRILLADLNKKLRQLSKQQQLNHQVDLLLSVPGVGLISALVLLTELIDIQRFNNLDRLCSFTGLIPDVQASGERERTCHITRRGNSYLKCILIECAWRAIREDPALLLYFEQYILRMKKNQAIIRIAKKLLSRVRYVWLHNKKYQMTTT